MTSKQIRHTVSFCLKHDIGSPETAKFLKDGYDLLTAIPVVQKFEVLRQVSPKNDFDFGFSMEFEDEASFETYCNHPIHVKFVEERWNAEVVRFLETDYRTL